MLTAIDSEFDSKNTIVELGETKFEESFAYTLYFFLKGCPVDVLSGTTVFNNIALVKQKFRYLNFLSKDTFEWWWHRKYKYAYYSGLNRFLRRWKLTNWLTKYT